MKAFARSRRIGSQVFPANCARRNLENIRASDLLPSHRIPRSNGYKTLAERLAKLDKERGTRGNRLFYLAVAPDQFDDILTNLKAAGLNRAPEGSWARVIVEKPFGTDLASAGELNQSLTIHFPKTDLSDRSFSRQRDGAEYPGLSFCERLVGPIWNTHYIDHVQITVAEKIGVEPRGYYEKSGALSDMVQNHLLQLFCLISMEPPVALDADEVATRK